MGFIEYFIKYTIVRNINRLFKPKTILAIVFVCVIVYFALSSFDWVDAVYMGDETYTDPNNTIYLAYNSICNDFIYRLSVAKNKANHGSYDDLIDYLNNDSLGYYIYYNNIDGISMLNGSTYDDLDLRICFYYLSNPNLSPTAFYTNYQGIDCDIKENNRVMCIFTINNGFVTIYETTSYGIYMPTALYNYRADIITNYLTNESEQQNNELINAINEQTNSINQQTNTIQQQTEYLQATPQTEDFSTSDLPTDSGVTDTTLDGINNIFTLFYNSMTREPTSADIIEITIPFTNKNIYIPYNYTDYYCPTVLKSLINMFWYYVGSVFIIKDLITKIEKLKTGNIENVETTNIKGDLL